MKKIGILSLLLLVVSIIYAQPGTLDPDFSALGGFNNKVTETWEQTDGKIIVVGYFSHYRGHKARGICRLNADGTIDASFLSGDGMGSDSYGTHVRCQTDGKILVTGNISLYNSTVLDHAPIIRLNANGSFDNTFNATFYGPINDILIQSSGKIVLVGSFQYITGMTSTYPFFTGPTNVIRLNANGSRDATFGTSAGANGAIIGVREQQDGKLVFAGGFTSFHGVSKSKICRTDANGVVDNTFLMTSNVNPSDMHLQADEKVILVGGFSTFNGNATPYIVRINTDGTVDNTFSCTLDNAIWNITAQADGKYVLVGFFHSVNGQSCHQVARINSDGTNDAGFTFAPYKDVLTSSSDFFTSTIQSNGGILIGGTFSYYGGKVCNHLLRLDASGNPDDTFMSNGGTNSRVYSVVNLPDDKILIGGDFQSYKAQPYSSICRLDASGNVDPTFNIGIGFESAVFYPEVYDIEVQSDGKYMVAGSFSYYQNQNAVFITRINTDGSKDATFLDYAHHGGNTNRTVRDIAIQQNGKIVVVGDFDIYYDYILNTVPRNGICRINTNGSIDASFDPGTAADEDVLVVKIQSDGQILAGGKFTTYNGISRNRIVRINTNGSIDNTFDPGTGADNNVTKIYLLDAGKIMLVGSFGNFNATPANNVVILNSNGSIDNTFTIKPHDGTITDVYRQADGKYLVVASGMTTYDNVACQGMVRINADGSIDNTFSKPVSQVQGFSASAEVDQVFIIGGHAMLYDNNVVNSIGLINLNNTTTSVMGLGSTEKVADYILFPNPSSGAGVTLKYVGTSTVSTGKIEVYDPSGRNVLTRSFAGNEMIFDDLGLSKGFYIVKVISYNTESISTLKLVIQ